MKISRQIRTVVAFVAVVLVTGTLGYRHISGGQSSWIDCLYMTVITITTIGYGEVVDLTGHPGGRVFTMLIALSGIGILTYVLTSITALAVEGRLHDRWRRRRMEKTIADWNGHYIVTGWGMLASGIVRELGATGRRFLVVVHRRAEVDRDLGDKAPEFVVEGDFTDDEVLKQARIDTAAGLFAVSGEDPVNLMLCLSARHLNPSLRIVASVCEPRNAAKMKQAGADSVVSSTAIGALRMASEMVRPAVVSFLDTMLRGTEPTLRVEEVPLPDACAGRTIGDLQLDRFREALLMAVRHGTGWVFHPTADRRLEAGDVLILMTTPDERQRILRDLSADT